MVPLPGAASGLLSRDPPSPGAVPGEQKPRTSLCKTGRECVPILQAAPSRPSPLFGERGECESPLHTGQGVGRSDVPCHQPPAPLPGLSPQAVPLYYRFTTNPDGAIFLRTFQTCNFYIKDK